MLLTESLLGTSSVAANYIEDVFSTYLYTGNSTSGGTQTITNSIDLSTKGGMVWIKGRSAASNNVLFDTARGAGTTASNNQALSSNLTTAEDLGASYDFLSAFNTDGFTVTQGGTTTATRGTNYNNVTYASWAFRKQAKFFDVVTYTGNGANRTIAHNLGSVPGCIMIKRTDTTGAWAVYHRSLANTNYMVLNTTSGEVTDSSYWNSTTPTSSVFSLGTATPVNANGGTYVAYLFAHDAGGFGASGSDNVISCGSFTTSASGLATVTLGYEPQWLLIKRTTASTFQNWRIIDTMRGCPVGNYGQELYPNVSDAEYPGSLIDLTATGFNVGPFLINSATYIYIAIRRGPMKTPTTGTSVFSAIAITGNGATQNVTSNFAPDALWNKTRGGGGVSYTWGIVDKLRMKGLDFTQTSGETAAVLSTFNNTGMSLISDGATNINSNGDTQINWLFRRAPGFFDVVCYTGTGSATTFNHNLGIAPELMIVKRRNATSTWRVYSNALTSAAYALTLNSTAAEASLTTVWNSTAPTSSVFSVGTSTDTNASGGTYVAYLFGTVAGVSKVGSYTGTGTTQQINCGFTGGARFVLIKRTDSTGDWYVWDSARGIVSGNDPYLLLNSTAAEVTNTDYIDTYSAGFEISSTAPAAINANGGSYIFMAVS